jgi:hypothetical protein
VPTLKARYDISWHIKNKNTPRLGAVLAPVGYNAPRPRYSTKYDLGTSKRDLGTTKHDLGTAKRDLGTTKYDLGTSMHDLGTTKYDLGTSKYDLGTTKHHLGTAMKCAIGNDITK